ncbi:UNKNOWN [Stylonychia lemnae]|uniref:Uncharacterized protein n=1 Tax=Stylonychia lemnae TaxID=5949 RepID=A0A078A5A8_STYLE|nr:UNKNOWN [Stylonychia lemnae]|eukprot:CDW77415.1 UNKNOWN [Stylonychia lemnae]
MSKNKPDLAQLLQNNENQLITNRQRLLQILNLNIEQNSTRSFNTIYGGTNKSPLRAKRQVQYVNSTTVKKQKKNQQSRSDLRLPNGQTNLIAGKSNKNLMSSDKERVTETSSTNQKSLAQNYYEQYLKMVTEDLNSKLQQPQQTLAGPFGQKQKQPSFEKSDSIFKLKNQFIKNDELVSTNNGQLIMDHYMKIMNSFDKSSKYKNSVSPIYMRNDKYPTFQNQKQQSFKDHIFHNMSQNMDDGQLELLYNHESQQQIFTDRSSKDKSGLLIRTEDLYKRKGNQMENKLKGLHQQNMLPDYPLINGHQVQVKGKLGSKTKKQSLASLNGQSPLDKTNFISHSNNVVNITNNYGMINNNITINLPDLSTKYVSINDSQMNSIRQSENTIQMPKIQQDFNPNQANLNLPSNQNLHQQSFRNGLKHFKIEDYYKQSIGLLDLNNVQDQVLGDNFIFKKIKGNRNRKKQDNHSQDQDHLLTKINSQTIQVNQMKTHDQNFENDQLQYDDEYPFKKQVVVDKSMYRVPKVKRKKVSKQNKSLNKKSIIVLTNVFVNLPSISFDNKKQEYYPNREYKCEIELKNQKGGRSNDYQLQYSKEDGGLNSSFYSIEPWEIPQDTEQPSIKQIDSANYISRVSRKQRSENNRQSDITSPFDLDQY